MDALTFISDMEERKPDRIEEVKHFKPRKIVSEMNTEKTLFDKKSDKSIFLFYGLRGIGKTVALFHFIEGKDAMFIDGTALSYYGLDLLDVVREYIGTKRYNLLVIDEIQKINNWGQALKVIYDNLPIKVFATGSSAIKIAKEKAPILRRAKIREIPPLSFREYLSIFKEYEIKLDPNEISDLLLSSPQDAYVKAKPLFVDSDEKLKFMFRDYLGDGFPLCSIFSSEEMSDYLVSKILTDDFPEIENFDSSTIKKAEKILDTLALSKPGVTSLSTLADIVECSKTTASDILNAYAISSVLFEVPPFKRSSSRIRKEYKYLFSSPTLRSGIMKRLIAEDEVGSLREDAFVSAGYFSGMKLFYLSDAKKTPDYVIKKGKHINTIEIGGPSKKTTQLKKGFLLVDDHKVNYSEEIVTIPLWLACLVH